LFCVCNHAISQMNQRRLQIAKLYSWTIAMLSSG